MGIVDKPHILVVDDEDKIRTILEDILSHEHYKVLLAQNGEEALRCVETNPVDLVLLDLVMPGMDGINILERMATLNPLLPVLIISAYGNIPLAVQATRLGAVDFIEKPIQMRDLLCRIKEQLRLSYQFKHNAHQIENFHEKYDMIGISSSIKVVYQKIERCAPTNARVLITGETGTGKELVAKAIHRLSLRANKPFVKINCAAIPPELIESELFGYRKGAFTGAFMDRDGKFQQAHRGSLFLDEIGDMSLMTQSKVLRVIEEGEVQSLGAPEVTTVDVRIVAATNKKLEEEVAKGNFRDDLFYRLNVITIDLPPLRERKEDIPYLSNHFLDFFCEEHNKRRKHFTRRAMEALVKQNWNGNIRELRNHIEKLVIFIENDVIDLVHIRDFLGRQKIEQTLELGISLKDARDIFEREFILSKLIANEWNISDCAEQLGIERTNLYRKMKQLEINQPMINSKGYDQKTD